MMLYFLMKYPPIEPLGRLVKTGPVIAPMLVALSMLDNR
jgi:hypothetical protein